MHSVAPTPFIVSEAARPAELPERLRLLMARLESLEGQLGRDDASEDLEDRVVRLAHRIRNELCVLTLARGTVSAPAGRRF